MTNLIVDPDHPGLYLLDAAGLIVDPDHPGLYLLDMSRLTPDPDHSGVYLLSGEISDLLPDTVAGSTAVAVTSNLARWEPFSPPPGMMYGARFASDGVNLYSIGGDPDVPRANVYAYNPATDVWISRAPLPIGRADGATAYLDGKVYYIAGYGEANSWESVNTVYAYDPTDDAAGWSSLAPLPVISSDGSSAVAFNGKLYFVPDEMVQDVYEYDPADDAAGWNLIAPHPGVTYKGKLAASADKLFLVGGYEDVTWNELKTVYSWDATAGWLSVADLPRVTSYGPAAFVTGESTDNRLWAMIGSKPNVYSYDPTDNAAGWRRESDLPIQTISGGLVQAGTSLFYLHTNDWLPPYGYKVSVLAPGILSLDVVLGSTAVEVAIADVSQPLLPDVVIGHTTVEIHPAIDLIPELVYSQNSTAITMILGSVFDLDVVVGSTDVHIPGDLGMKLDHVRGSTTVELAAGLDGPYFMAFDKVTCYTKVRIIRYLHQGREFVEGEGTPRGGVLNTPILLAVSARARLEQIEPLVST